MLYSGPHRCSRKHDRHNGAAVFPEGCGPEQHRLLHRPLVPVPLSDPGLLQASGLQLIRIFVLGPYACSGRVLPQLPLPCAGRSVRPHARQSCGRCPERSLHSDAKVADRGHSWTERLLSLPIPGANMHRLGQVRRTNTIKARKRKRRAARHLEGLQKKHPATEREGGASAHMM